MGRDIQQKGHFESLHAVAEDSFTAVKAWFRTRPGTSRDASKCWSALSFLGDMDEIRYCKMERN